MTPDSKLVKGTMWSPNYSTGRKYKIDTIIIHCMAGTYDARRCGELFANPSRQASSTYGISSNGDIWQYVEEKNRPWTTGGRKTVNGWTGAMYDQRSVTIEVSNTTLAPDYQVSAAAMNSIVELCADICRRNGIKKLLWQNNPALVGNAKKQNMALHRWFDYKACPGNYLVNAMAGIALAVNQRLGQSGFVLNGYDYSPVFNPTFYANKYKDLKDAFGYDPQMLWLHFQNFGMNESRQASAEFDPLYYRAHNADVEDAFDDDWPMYYLHYVAFGKSEGRKGAY